MNSLTPVQRNELTIALELWQRLNPGKKELPIVVSPHLSLTAAPNRQELRYRVLQDKNQLGFFEWSSIERKFRYRDLFTWGRICKDIFTCARPKRQCEDNDSHMILLAMLASSRFIRHPQMLSGKGRNQEVQSWRHRAKLHANNTNIDD